MSSASTEGDGRARVGLTGRERREQLVQVGQLGIATRHAAMYAHILVGMVAVTGTWWLEERTLKRDEVATHRVNLGWNGSAHLETRPRAITVPR